MLCLGDSLTDLPISLLRAQTGISNTRMIFNTPSPFALNGGQGILTLFPSVTLISLTLGADSPCSDERRAGNLGLTASGLFTHFNVTHVSIRTSDTSSSLYKPPSQAYRTLPYPTTHKRRCRSFGAWFSPVTSSAQADSTSELLRFL